MATDVWLVFKRPNGEIDGDEEDSESEGKKKSSDKGDTNDMEDSVDDKENYRQPRSQNVVAMDDKSKTPLFCGSIVSKLDVTLMIMNVC